MEEEALSRTGPANPFTAAAEAAAAASPASGGGAWVGGECNVSADKVPNEDEEVRPISFLYSFLFLFSVDIRKKETRWTKKAKRTNKFPTRKPQRETESQEEPKEQMRRTDERRRGGELGWPVGWAGLSGIK